MQIPVAEQPDYIPALWISLPMGIFGALEVLPMMVVCDLRGAGHLVLAIETYARVLRQLDKDVPVELLQAAREIRNQVTSGQGGSFVEAMQAAVDAAVMDERLLMTYREAGERLAVSESTVKREIAAGRLRAIKVGGSARVHRDDLMAYTQELREGGADQREAG